METLILLSPQPPTVGAAMWSPGIWELVLILVIVLVIFGPGKLPQIGEALGKSIKSFKKATDAREEIDVTPHELAPGKSADQKVVGAEAREREKEQATKSSGPE